MTASPPEAPETAARSFIADAVTSVLGTAGGQLITIAAIPILSRLYAPEHFGIWALYLAIVAVIPVLTTLRLDIAIVAARTETVAREVATLAVLLSIVGGIIVGAIVLAFGLLPIGNSWLRSQLEWLAWLPLGVVSSAIYSVGLSWWLRMRAYRAITLARIVLALASAVLQAAFAGLPDGIGLVLGNLAGQALTAVAVVLAMIPAMRAASAARHLRLRFVAVVKRFRGLALYTTPYSLQQQVFRHAMVVVLTALASVETSGIFAMAQRSVLNPLTLIAAALEQSIYPRIARAPNDPDIHRLVATTMQWLAILLGASCAVVTIFAQPLVVFALGTKWLPAAPYVVAVSYASATLVASSWLVRVFDIFGRQRLHLVVDLAGNLAILAACIIALRIWNDPLWGVVALCAGMAAYYAAWTALAFHVSRMAMRPLVRILLAGVATWIMTLALSILASWLLGIGLAA